MSSFSHDPRPCPTLICQTDQHYTAMVCLSLSDVSNITFGYGGLQTIAEEKSTKTQKSLQIEHITALPVNQMIVNL